MAAILALSAAVAYGVGDFLGGVAARRESATVVVLWSHLVGLIMLLMLVPLLGGDVTPRAMAVGAVAGLLGGTGVALFYRGLAVGAMSVVAPIAALLSAAVPVVAGLIAGERPTPAALAGIALALGAIVLVSRDAAPRDRGPVRWQALALAVGAGLAFGLFFVVISHAGEGVGIWPLVGARAASVALFLGLGAAGVTAAAPPKGAIGAIVACGVLDAGANVFLLLALDRGLLSVVSVLTALYPAGTVLLARYVLGEDLRPVQRAGLGVAGMAAVLIAL
ncbi:MAG TPA: DMT family transporter [Acidimicrobiales bacterium]|nr:DMT family transporter [Acidimicrobiales bacterium]